MKQTIVIGTTNVQLGSNSCIGTNATACGGKSKKVFKAQFVALIVGHFVAQLIAPLVRLILLYPLAEELHERIIYLAA